MHMAKPVHGIKPDDDIDDGTVWTDAGNRKENDEAKQEEDRIGSGTQSEISIQEKKPEKCHLSENWDFYLQRLSWCSAFIRQ